MSVEWDALLSSMQAQWLRAFVLTQIVEMGVYVQIFARPLRERLAIAFAASAITHPLVWFVVVDLTRYFVHTGDYRADHWIGVAVAEAFAVLAEAGWLTAFGLPTGRAFAWALFANAWSFTIGLFCYECLAW